MGGFIWRGLYGHLRVASCANTSVTLEKGFQEHVYRTYGQKPKEGRTKSGKWGWLGLRGVMGVNGDNYI